MAKEKPFVASDAIFSFGKYKGKAVSLVANEDPSYIMWLRESGYRLDDELMRVAENYAVKNPGALQKLRDRIGVVSTVTATPVATPAAKEVDRKEDALWGCW